MKTGAKDDSHVARFIPSWLESLLQINNRIFQINFEVCLYPNDDIEPNARIVGGKHMNSLTKMNPEELFDAFRKALGDVEICTKVLRDFETVEDKSHFLEAAIHFLSHEESIPLHSRSGQLCADQRYSR